MVDNWEIFIDFVLIAGMSLLGLIIGFLLKSNVPFSKKLLVVFFINAFSFLLYYYAYLHKIRLLGGIAILLGNGVGFLLGPMILYQLKSLVLPKQQIVSSLCKSLIPFFIVWLLISVPLAVTLVTGYFPLFHQYYLKYEIYLNQLENIFFITYLILTFKFLKRIQNVYKDNYSALDKNNLNWYRHLIIGFIVIVIVDTGCTIYELFYPIIPWNIGNVVAFTIVGMYVYLGYKGIFQARILMPEFLLDKITQETILIKAPEVPLKTIEDQNPVTKSTIRQLNNYSQDQINHLNSLLKKLLEEEKLYRNEALNLTELADHMGISNKKLSELLNQHLNTNFYTLINDYRVEEVKKRLATNETEQFTILSIAYDCGFQSKTSFNRIFKQKTGISPSEYLKTL